ncbi:MAG: YchF/TatD family DNA exonuclease [Candidatus Schekmanbacteria bacterium]|nr:YchF/TatD family DNA exonuclease [Candidatus Schekmanbacteria bacterium]
MLIDSHAHLEMPEFAGDLPQVLERANQAGVSHIITIGSDLASCYKAHALAQKHERIYAAVGIHPHEAQDFHADTLRQIKTLAQSPKVVAIGESGLDYHYLHSPEEVQRRVFREQLNLACELNLPVIIHNRQAEDDLLMILKDLPVIPKGVLHCFSGSEAFLHKCLDYGFYISIAGPVTFPKAGELRELVRLIPNDRLLLETDCPYLSPAPWRGRRNEPAHLKATAQKVAELKGLSLEDIGRISSLNTQQLFGIAGVETAAKIAYPIRDSLYLNITNRCTNNCTFCARQKSYYVQGHYLRLAKEPTLDEIIAALPDLQPYKELVFCGFGEPMLRLEALLAVAKHVKAQGKTVRVNTNGQANLIYGRNIVPELVGLVDALSISLNAPSAGQYQQLCQSVYGDAAYQSIIEFARNAVVAGLQVTLTALDLPQVDLTACAKAAQEIGAAFRIRHYDVVG